MNKTKKRSFTVLLCALVCALALVLSLGILSACGGSESANVDESTGEATWYYGDAEPAEGLGKAGDYYLNTKTLASYVKEGKTWREATAGETGSWYNGTEAPQDTLGNPNDLYLNTKTGELYRKTEGGWGSPLLVLQGKDGREGVIWHSGEGVPGTIEDAHEGDFYLDYSEFRVYQLQADGTWNPLGSLKGSDGVTPTIEGFLTGTGAPDPALGADNDFYLDTESGKIWQKNGYWSSKGSLGNLNASQIKEIRYIHRQYGKQHYGQWSIRNPLDEMGDTWSIIQADQFIYGYWLLFEDNSSFFIPAKCTHATSAGQNALITLYNDDCTFGTVQILKCAYCGETVTQVTEPTGNPNHRYAEGWTSDETDHWHAVTCSHRDAPVQKFGHAWRDYYTVDYDGESVKGYIKWQECRVCGYKISEKIITADSLVQGDTVHISNADEWNAFAKAVNSGATYGEGKKFSEATVELDGDINFGGMELIPVGVPTNAADVTDRTNGAYLDLKAEAHIEGGFSGHFDGKGHKISGFTLDSGNFTGLFGYLNNATVTDLTVEKATVTGDAFVGTVAGFITGTDVRISKVTVVDTKVKGLVHVGGIAGYAKNAGPQVTTANTGSEAAIKNCTVMSVTGTSANHDSAMTVTAAFANKPDSDGYYFDGTNVGGILGTSYSSSVIGCYVKEILVRVAPGCTGSAIVGYAEGTETEKSIVVGNIVSVQNGANNCFSDANYYTKDGITRVPGDGGRGKYKIKVQKFGLGYTGDVNGNGNLYVHHKKYIKDQDEIYWERFVVNSNKESTTETPYEGAGGLTSIAFRSYRQNDEGPVENISTADQLETWATRVDGGASYANYTIKLMNDIPFPEGQTWYPISIFSPENSPLQNAVFDGQGYTISNLHTEEDASTSYPYGVAMFGVVTGTFTIQNVTFDDAHMHFNEGEYYGNVVGVVVAYAYGNLTFNNVSVTNSEVWGFGKVGTLLGMGADPGVHITFNGCTSENNILHGAYNVGGFAGNIQRASDGTDNTVFVKDSGNLSKGNQYILNQKEFTVDAEADFLHNDRTGTTYDQIVKGVYVEVGAAGYLYGGWAEYYISYGSSSYDPLITTGEYAGYRVANSEICMNEAQTFEHGYVPPVTEE